MSTKHSGAFSSTDTVAQLTTTDDDVDTESLIGVIDELVDKVEQLTETVDRRGEIIDRQDHRIEQLADTADRQEETIERLESHLPTADTHQGDDSTAPEDTSENQQGQSEEGTDEDIEDLAQRVDIHESRLDGFCDSLDRIEDDIGKLTSDPDADTPASDGTLSTPVPLTDIERLIDDPLSSGIKPTKSVQRAMSILTYFDKWSDPVHSGRVITDNLKTYLSTATGENLTWRQVYRVCDKLDELSNGCIKFIKHKEHGRMLSCKNDGRDFLARVRKRKRKNKASS